MSDSPNGEDPESSPDEASGLDQTLWKDRSGEIARTTGSGPIALPEEAEGPVPQLQPQQPSTQPAVADVPPPAVSPQSAPTSAAMPATGRSSRDLIIGASVAGYVVKGKIGSGGMGIVYEGEHSIIGKKVAIKVLRPEMAENPEQVEALVSEARAVNQVGHRGIIDVFGYGELPDGRQCIIMEFLEGESLADVLEKNRREGHVMPLGEVMLILEEMLSAIAAAHGAGVVHRDLKPSNIFLARQRDGSRYVKVLDFGIAKLGVHGGAKPTSRPSIMVGTPAYMSPEQARGGVVGPAMDLYALGVMAFELLTNKLPFEGQSVVEVLFKHSEAPPPKPSEILMSIPDEVDDIVLSLMQKKPEDRPPDANSVRLVVKRVRKLLLHSTRHPELRLTRDLATGKVVLEEVSQVTGKPAPKPAASGPKAPKTTKASDPSLPRAKPADASDAPTAAAWPAVKGPPPPGMVSRSEVKTQVADPSAEPTNTAREALAAKSAAAKARPKTKPPSVPVGNYDATLLPGQVQLSREELGLKPVATTPWAIIAAVGAAALLGGAVVVWKLKGQAQPAGPAIVEIPTVPPGPGTATKAELVPRLNMADVRFATAAQGGKEVSALRARVKAVREQLNAAPDGVVEASLEAQVVELEKQSGP